MIINLIITVILSLVAFIFSFLPIVSVSDLPVIGSAVATNLLKMVTTWNAIVVTLPYLGIVSTIFFEVILPFEFTMLIGKFFFGNRLPANTN